MYKLKYNFRNYHIADYHENKQIAARIHKRLIPTNDEPYYIEYYDDGTTAEMYWIGITDNHCKLHRIRKPAHLIFYGDGHLREERWYYNGKLYRTTGPAMILHTAVEDNFAKICSWWINDNQILTEEVDLWMKENNINWPFDRDAEILFKLRFE